MEVFKLDKMTKGWFVGAFSPTILHSDQYEVAIKYYKKGDCEERHLHKIGTELTAIASGKVKMNGQEFCAGDIVKIPPGESTDFEVLEDTCTVVVKTPSVAGDKYLVLAEQ